MKQIDNTEAALTQKMIDLENDKVILKLVMVNLAILLVCIHINELYNLMCHKFLYVDAGAVQQAEGIP